MLLLNFFCIFFYFQNIPLVIYIFMHTSIIHTFHVYFHYVPIILSFSNSVELVNNTDRISIFKTNSYYLISLDICFCHLLKFVIFAYHLHGRTKNWGITYILIYMIHPFVGILLILWSIDFIREVAFFYIPPKTLRI